MHSYKTGLAKNALYGQTYFRLLITVFGVVALIFGEFTPVVVWLFGTSFLPGTCITTAQLDNRRRKRMDNLDRKSLPITPRVTPTIEQVKQLPRRTIIHECRCYPFHIKLTKEFLGYSRDGHRYTSSRQYSCAKWLSEESTILNMTTN
jgi:hypothetical protein